MLFRRPKTRLCPTRYSAPVQTGLAVLIFCATSCLVGDVYAQSLAIQSGVTRMASPSESTYGWGFSYTQPIGNVQALSYSWINEGHFVDNHRDGFALQYWLNTHVFDRHLTLAAGIGPYTYFDTVASIDNRPYKDIHGLAVIYSVSATWQTDSPWFYQIVVDRIDAPSSINTTDAMLGIGYQLGKSDHGLTPIVTQPGSGDQIDVMGGETVVNSLRTPTAFARSVEYRHGFGAYVDGTLTWLDEGSTILTRRNGGAAQIWLGHDFFGDRLRLSVGAGPYLAIDTYRVQGNTEATGDKVSALLTMSASYNFTRHWLVRASWDRVLTGYDKDSDIFLGGIGYRF